VLIAPTLHVVDPAEASILWAWVEAGGRLLLGVRSGFKTPSNRVTPAPLPGALRGLAGAAVTDWHGLPPGVSYPLDWMGVPGLGAGAAGIWAEALAPDDGTDVLARYSDGPFAGSAAVTEHTCGSGAVTYVGVHPTLEVCAELASRVAAPAALERLAPEGHLLPDGLLAIRRGAEAIILNFTDGRLAATVGGVRVEVGPRDVAVVSLD
jgi:beta-galactosidase